MAGYDFKHVSDFFKDGIYQVPEYQRNYAWENRQLNDLWEDLETIDIETKSNHYTGTIVVENVEDISKFGKSYKKYKIIDGQQRLTTLTILLFSIVERLKKIENNEDVKKTAENILNEYLYDSSTGIFKLELNGSDDCFLKDVVLQVRPEEMVGKRAETASQKRMLEAKLFFRNKLMDKNYIFLENLIQKVTNRLLLIRYEVGNEIEAGLVFEVMNDRGKPLTQVDKIKNYLMYVAYKKDDSDLASSINEVWGEIFKNILSVDNFDEDDLLRHHWIMYQGQYETKLVSDVHRRLKEKFILKNEDILNRIKKYTNSLKETSYVYKELNNPNFSFKEWPKTNLLKIRTNLNGLHRLRNTATFMPLLIAGRIVFKDDVKKFEDLTRLCEIFAFRVYKVSNRRTDTRYSTFCKLAHKLFSVRKQSQKKKNAVFNEIDNEIRSSIYQYSDDEEFTENLKRDDIYWDWLKPYEIKYLLYEFEKNKCEKSGESSTPYKDIESKTEIEHILPQNPRDWKSWKKADKQLHEDNVDRLGNLTLTFWNKTLSNKDFLKKREKYKESNLIIQRELRQHNMWGKKQIEKRTKNIINFASERWKVDFTDFE